MTCKLNKYNSKGVKQVRDICVTTNFFYNLDPNKLSFAIGNFFNPNYIVKRKIDISRIEAISLSRLSR